MSREEYIKWRKENIGQILYTHYLENFKEKHTNLLNMADFFMCFQQWPLSQQAVQSTLMHYDAKFNVLMIPDRQGNVIRYE